MTAVLCYASGEMRLLAVATPAPDVLVMPCGGLKLHDDIDNPPSRAIETTHFRSERIVGPPYCSVELLFYFECP